MELWEDKDVFRGLVRSASKNLGIADFIVERDFYTMEAPDQISQQTTGAVISKAYTLTYVDIVAYQA
jgi:hypothetical protein